MAEPNQLIELQCSICEKETSEFGIRGDMALCHTCRAYWTEYLDSQPLTGELAEAVDGYEASGAQTVATIILQPIDGDFYSQESIGYAR